MRQKTPVSNSSATSRTPTPTPTPTSRSHSKSNRSNSFLEPIDSFYIFISNDKVLFPVTIILSLLLASLTINFAPSFCAADGSSTSFKCHQCPSNSRCGAISFECEENFTRINNNCVTTEQASLYKDEQNNVSALASRISQLLNEEDVPNLDDLSRRLDESPDPIRTAIEFTDFRINCEDDTIERVFTNPSISGYWLLALISSLFITLGVITLGYHFLRTK